MDLKLLSRDWDHESYPASSDLWVIIFFAPFFLFLRLILDRFIFERVARRLVVPRGHYGDSNERRKKIVKFKESAWKCLCSFSVEALALYVTYKEPWFKDTRCFWLGPGDQIWPDQKIKLKMKGMYMFVGGLNVYAFFALFYWETRRSDFKVMLVHHIVTSFLINLSYVLRFSRIGSVILALHEISDVFLEIGKMCKYSGAEAMTSVSFILFFLSWTALRLIYYPLWILWSTSYESIKVKMEYWDKKHLMETGPNLMVFYYVFNTLLYCLQILHIYWWILIYRVLISQIRAKGKVAKDIRSDSEDEDDEHHD
ncbi:TRAM/LAG1/CLN8 homology domain [Arabidopsis suecica]|uniref:TRAM/LAG1/CLN8 homology domain n=1 Tax=Arabidopsis suecica TaxID=45249 RepID=A0A8T2CD83_ARASU|nr:TRAM/LAG1/CLN8 homology domain [Arabidopsis suecica]